MNTQYELIDKNYYRLLLSKAGDKPIVLRGKYKRTWDSHVTFTTIRPYIEGVHTKTVCNHINILRSEVENQIDIETLVKNRTYFIIAYCHEYRDGSGRIGLSLASNTFERTLFIVDDIKYITDEVIDKCYRFNVEEFKR